MKDLNGQNIIGQQILSSDERSGEWIDISVPIYSGMVHWPGDPSVNIELVHAISRGDAANVSKLALGAHTGTHMDAPGHFISDGAAIHEMPLDATIGRVRVIPVENNQAIFPEELELHNLQEGERILFRTINSERCWKDNRFIEDFVYISALAAKFLVHKKVRTIGIDYLSVGGYIHDGIETHQILLGAGIWLIEGLNLSEVKPGIYDMICLPLKIVGADGSPARIILRRTGQ